MRLTDITVTGGRALFDTPFEDRVAGIYSAGFLVLDGATSVVNNGGVRCPVADPACSMREGWVGGVINIGRLELRNRASIVDNHGGFGIGGVRNEGIMEMHGHSSIEGSSVGPGSSGAGVWNGGQLSLHDRAAIRDNLSLGLGGRAGGVLNVGVLELNDRSSIEDNEVSQYGAGIINEGGTIVLNDRSSVRNNRAYSSAGISSRGGVIILNDRYAITGNVARNPNSVGGIAASTDTTIIGSLDGITGNTPGQCAFFDDNNPPVPC